MKLNKTTFKDRINLWLIIIIFTLLIITVVMGVFCPSPSGGCYYPPIIENILTIISIIFGVLFAVYFLINRRKKKSK